MNLMRDWCIRLIKDDHQGHFPRLQRVVSTLVVCPNDTCKIRITMDMGVSFTSGRKSSLEQFCSECGEIGITILVHISPHLPCRVCPLLWREQVLHPFARPRWMHTFLLTPTSKTATWDTSYYTPLSNLGPCGPIGFYDFAVEHMHPSYR